MLETRLVVDDHVFIVSGILVDLGLENAVDKAVAALALRSSHDEHVEIVFFDERGIELHLRVIGLCHVGRNRALLLGSCHFLADVSERGFDLHAEHLVEVGVCVRIHNEDGTLFLLAQIIDDHAAGGRLADAALTGDRDGMCCHWYCSFESALRLRQTNSPPEHVGFGFKQGQSGPPLSRYKRHRRTC